jgi:hypothetical protein
MMKEFERKMNEGMGRETDMQPRIYIKKDKNLLYLQNLPKAKAQ